MGDFRTLCSDELAKYGHFCTQQWLVILYVLAKGREVSSRPKKRHVFFIASTPLKQRGFYISHVRLWFCSWSRSKSIC